MGFWKAYDACGTLAQTPKGARKDSKRAGPRTDKARKSGEEAGARYQKEREEWTNGITKDTSKRPRTNTKVGRTDYPDAICC
jgi:hypothetical protein